MIKINLTTILIVCLLMVEAAAQNVSGAEPPGEQRILVQSFQFSGNSVISSKVLSGLVADSQGKELSLADLQAVADGISEYYHQRGYVLAKAILPEQEIVNGAITLHIFEGKIGKIIIQGNESYSPDFLQAYFNGMRKEGVFRQQALERAVLLMNNLQGMTVTSMLQAGEETGTTDLIVTVKEGKQFKANMTVDNFGSQYARVRAKSGFDFINRMGRGDILSLNGVTGINSDKLYYFNGSYMVPINSRGTTLSFYGLSGNFGIGKEFAVLDIQGKATSFGISLARTLHQNHKGSTVLEYGLDARNSKQNILGTISSEDKIRSFRLTVRRNAESTTGRTFSSLTVQQGLGEALGGMTNSTPMSSRSASGADNNFTKFNFDYGRAQRTGPKSALLMRFMGQLSLSNLVVGEQMAIGGADSVRGYPQAEFLGDSGFQASIEARFASSASRMEKLQFATFIDFGYVSLKIPVLGQKKTQSLTGAGFGVRYNPGHGLYMRADVGFPIGEKPSSNKSSTYYLQLIKQSE